MKCARWTGGMVLLGTALAMAPSAMAQTAAPAQGADTQALRQRFEGAPFRYAGGDAQRQDLAQAIEQTTARMNFITRPIGRGRLRDRNPVYDTIAFHFPPGLIEVVLAGRKFQAREDFSPTPGHAVTGEPVQVREHWVGDHIVQTLTSSEGVRQNVFSTSEDGHHAIMRVTMSSRQLPQPLTYSLSYAR